MKPTMRKETNMNPIAIRRGIEEQISSLLTSTNRSLEETRELLAYSKALAAILEEEVQQAGINAPRVPLILSTREEVSRILIVGARIIEADTRREYIMKDYDDDNGLHYAFKCLSTGKREVVQFTDITLPITVLENGPR